MKPRKWFNLLCSCLLSFSLASLAYAKKPDQTGKDANKARGTMQNSPAEIMKNRDEGDKKIKQAKADKKLAKGAKKADKKAEKATRKASQQQDISPGTDIQDIGNKAADEQPSGLAKQREKKAAQERKELDKGSEQGQQQREEKSRKWWRFWE